jgi:hypothetical protein
MDERKQLVPMRVERTGRIAHFAIVAAQEFRCQVTDLPLNRDRLLDQFAARQHALAGPSLAAEPIPQAKQPLDCGKHVTGEMLGVFGGSELRDPLESSLQMRPAKLGQAAVVSQVGRTTIRTQDRMPANASPATLYQHLHTAAASDVVEHEPRGAQHPNPALVAIGAAAGFVAVQHRLRGQ